jgi:hypothetical protein
MQQPIDPSVQQPISYSLREITELLIKHQELHEGLYELSFQFQIAVGGVKTSPENVLPGAMFGVSAIGLSKSEEENMNTIDAAQVNPLKKGGRKSLRPKK